MRAWMLIVLSIVGLGGCVTARPRWEVVVTVQVEDQPTPTVKIKGGVELRRPIAIPGNTLNGGSTKPLTEGKR